MESLRSWSDCRGKEVLRPRVCLPRRESNHNGCKRFVIGE